MEKTWSLRLIRFSAIFGLFGTFLGSQMAGEMDYALRPIHCPHPARRLAIGVCLGDFLPGLHNQIQKACCYS